MKKTHKEIIHGSVRVVETILAFLVIAVVIVFVINNANMFALADWQAKEVFYEFIYRVLLITIGLELARMLVTHNYLSILELMAFVVARKMLKPEVTTAEVALGVVSFVIILAANKYLIGTGDSQRGKKIVHRL